MTQQIDEILEYIKLNFNEAYSNILRTHFSHIERRNAELTEDVKLTINVSKNILNELDNERKIKEYLISSFKEQIEKLKLQLKNCEAN